MDMHFMKIMAGYNKPSDNVRDIVHHLREVQEVPLQC